MTLTTGLRAYFSFDAASGPWGDSTGNGYTATAAGTTGSITSVGGRKGNAVRLSGGPGTTAPYIILPVATIQGLTSGTIACWVRYLSYSAGAQERLWDLGPNHNSSSYFLPYYSNRQFIYQFAGQGSTISSVGQCASLNEWIHVGLTWDGTSTRVWVNGVNVMETLNNRSMVWYDTNGGISNFWIGKSLYSTSDAMLNADVDEFAVWGRALSSDEFLTLHNRGQGLAYADLDTATTPSIFGGNAASVGLQAYWSMDEADNTSPKADSTSNGNNLTNTATGYVTGRKNNAANLTGGTNDGTTPYLAMPNSMIQGSSGNGPFTLMGWFNRKGTTSWQRLIDINADTSNTLWLSCNNGQLQFSCPSVNVGFSFTSPVTDTWNHWCLTVGSSTGWPAIRLYINGSLIGELYQNVNLASFAGTLRGWFGRSVYTADVNLQGWLDDWMFYSRAFSASEIKFAMSNTNGYAGVATTPATFTWGGTSGTQPQITRSIPRAGPLLGGQELPKLLSGQGHPSGWINQQASPVIGFNAATIDSDVGGYATNVTTVGGTLSINTLNALNNFVIGLKSDSVWNKLLMIWPCCGSNLVAALCLLKSRAGDPTSLINNNFVSGDYLESGMTGGLKGDGMTKYLDTGISIPTLSAADFSMGVYLRNNISGAVIGASYSPTGSTDRLYISSVLGSLAGVMAIGADVSSTNIVANTGTYILQISDTTTMGVKGYQDGYKIMNLTGSSITWQQPGTIQLFGVGTAYSSSRISFAFVGNGMTDTDVATLSGRVQALQADLGRNATR